MFGDDLINQAVILGLLSGHIVVALGVPLQNLQRLAGVLAQQLVHAVLDVDHVVGVDLDVGGLTGQTAALAADERLMDQDLGIGQRIPLALGAAGQQETPPSRRPMPTQMVETSHLIYCMVSWMAMPSVMEPPGLLI